MSLFWMEPALGDAVISSVRSESRPDSSHQKACLLKISHMTAGGAKAAVPPCDTPAAARCCAVRKRPCLVVSPARVMLCVIRPLSLSLPRSEPQPRSMLCVKQSCLVLWTAIFLPLAALASSCVDVSRSWFQVIAPPFSIVSHLCVPHCTRQGAEAIMLCLICLYQH